MVLRDSLAVAIPVGTYGAAFGAAAIGSGFSVLQTCLLSLLLFSGASQFAVVGVMGAGGSPLSAIATGSLLGLRNGLYGLRMAPILSLHGVRKFIGAQLTIDESTGVAGIGVYFFWNLFTLIGAVGANSIGDPSAWGLDAAVPAAFLGLVWPRLVDTKSKIVGVIAALLALLLIPVAPAGVPIIATALLAIAFGWRK
ncbi:MAG: branched-chain amino acid ABC transporter permease [Actinobacteria bacterium]|nr:branched-chain amino acid ABC transporter permease [Actinomycetota bacterium]